MSNIEGQLSRRRAIVLLEATVSIMLIGIVLGAVSLLMVRYSQSVDYFLNYRRAQLAAESCIARMRAGELPVAAAIMNDPGGVTRASRRCAAGIQPDGPRGGRAVRWSGDPRMDDFRDMAAQ